METAQITKQIDSIKQTWASRATKGAKYRIDVLWSYDAANGDKLYAQGDSHTEDENGAKVLDDEAVSTFNNSLDDLLRNDSAARITVKFTDRSGRNGNTYTVVLREAYSQYPHTLNIPTPAPAKQQTIVEKQAQPQQNLGFGLGAILSLLGGDTQGGLDGVGDDGTQRALKGVQTLLDFRDKRKDEEFERARLTERNENLRNQLSGVEQQKQEFSRKLDDATAKMDEMKKTIEAMETQIKNLKEENADLKDDNKTTTAELNKAKDAGPLGAVASQIAGSLLSNAVDHFARTHSGFVGKLLGVSGPQFLGMLNGTDDSQQDDEDDDDDEQETDVQPTPQPAAAAEVATVESQPAPQSQPVSGTAVATSGDNISRFADSIEVWMRKMNAEDRDKFGKIINEMYAHPETFKDVYDMAITQ